LSSIEITPQAHVILSKLSTYQYDINYIDGIDNIDDVNIIDVKQPY